MLQTLAHVVRFCAVACRFQQDIGCHGWAILPVICKAWCKISQKKPSTIFQKLLKLLVFCIIIYVYYYAHKAV